MGAKHNAMMTLAALTSVLTTSGQRAETRTPVSIDVKKIDWAPYIKQEGAVYCPLPKDVDVFLVMGQSQAANMAERKLTAQSQASYMFNKAQCYQLRDPVLGATNRDGSIWPAFADYMGGRVMIANLAISGSSISEWTAKSQMNKIKDTVSQLETAGYRNFKVIWVQGEADDMIKMPADEYYKHLNTLAGILPGRQWVITKQSHCGWQGGNHNAINVAKDRFVADDPAQRAIGPNLDELGADFRMHLDCHFSIFGQSVLAQRMANAVINTMELQVVRWPLDNLFKSHQVYRPQK